MSTTIIANSSTNTTCMFHQFFNGFIFLFGSGNGLIQIINISLMMFAMMNLHGCAIDMRLQCFKSIR